MLDSILFAFVTAAFGTALAAPIIRVLSERFGITDNPANDVLKVHRRPISNLGGIVVFFGFTAALVAARVPLAVSWHILSFSGLALLFGLIDDIWWQKRSSANIIIKLLLQLILAGLAASWIVVDPLHRIFPALAAGLLVITTINAINMQDGLDGLLSGITLTSAVGFFFVFLLRGDFVGAAFSAVLAGCAIGFLTANFPPATIFLGDSGSYCIGGILAFLVFGVTENVGLQALPAALLLLGMPLFNLFFVIVRRLFARQSPLVGDRLHVYDLINVKTGSAPRAVAITVALHALSVGAGVVIFLNA